MAKLGATNTRVEQGVGSFEGQWFGYAKQDTSQDEQDTYDYRYHEVGPFKTKDAAQAAAERKFAQLDRAGPLVRAAAGADEDGDE
jgi:hypothetical protein